MIISSGNMLPVCFLLPLISLFSASISAITNESQLLDCTNATQFQLARCPPNVSQRKDSRFTRSDHEHVGGKQALNDGGELCKVQLQDATGSKEDGWNKQAAASLVVCSPTPAILRPSSPTTTTADTKVEQHKKHKKILEVFIRTVPNNVTQLDPGASILLECRFNTTLDQELSFRLKWLRSVVESPRVNQSISATSYQVTNGQASPATTRLWTVQRRGGLDLLVNDFQASDEGSYFCQAVVSDSPQASPLSEARVQLTLANVESGSLASASGEPAQLSDINAHDAAFSQENLSKLLPSLMLVPQYAELSPGDAIQLACVTSHLDPDPEPNEIHWSFEPLGCRGRRLDLLAQSSAPEPASELPANSSILGNVLMVWSASDAHCGIYKCSYHLAEFNNISVQASAEITLRPTSNSAPLVSVEPEMVRLSPGGSAELRCEASGYPPPEITWYRVDDQATSSAASGDSPAGPVSHISMMKEDDGISYEKIPYQDTMFYCEHHGCSLKTGNSQVTSHHHRRPTQVTGISLVHLKRARAHHQGQYVCRASNKHGSNQASAIVDVEFREAPVVRIAAEHQHQSVELQSGAITTPDGGDFSAQQVDWKQQQQQKVTFKCSVESGRPLPRLRWLRASPTINSNQLLSQIDNQNLDLYDLQRVSSATANVSLWPADQGRSMVLVVDTISLDDEGDYVCLGENQWGRHSAVAHLTVLKPAKVRIVQSSPKMVRVNESFQLDCLASGHPIPQDLEWSRTDRGAFFSLISRGAASNTQGGQLRAVLKFDRVTADESGEYTCNARDPLNSTLVLRDTIMVLVETNQQPTAGADGGANSEAIRAQLPKLLVRPTKTNALVGSNLTLDCLAVSGLQPTLVEWVAPFSSTGGDNGTASSIKQQLATVWPYYRNVVSSSAAGDNGQLVWQFGSKLRILNISKHNEGVYQCKGRNRLGAESAPALVRVIDDEDAGTNGVQDSTPDATGSGGSSNGVRGEKSAAVKTKVARVGTNIELKCQVSGVKHPATSWSRDGLELPASSVQIGHNMWIQNVSHSDSGLYVCSARSAEPNRVFQARIRLVVSSSGSLVPHEDGSRANLSAKIVASKSSVNIGDSITLECIVSEQQERQKQQLQIVDTPDRALGARSVDLGEIERNIVWTNSHSGQSVFQENVYVQDNLLIIYNLKPKNSATYRCNYNELTQHTDYKLQIAGASLFEADESATETSGAGLRNTSAPGSELKDHRPANHTVLVSGARRAFIRQVPVGSQLRLDCSSTLISVADARNYFHQVRGQDGAGLKIADSASLVFRSIRTSDADIYHCYRDNELLHSTIVHVTVPVARFAQRPVSFISLPSISGADHQLELELKFLAERDHGLILFNGQHHGTNNRSSPGDYISLGLNRGHLEFRFELGDGTTLLRSQQSVSLNQWHRVRIERNRRDAWMFLQGQPPVKTSSAGKFFELNLDSVLYVGGHQHFLDKKATAAGTRPATARFFGYSRGFQGCISELRVARVDMDLMAQNRSAAIGIYECDKPECPPRTCTGPRGGAEGLGPMGVCQVMRPRAARPGASHQQQQHQIDWSCICLPGLGGDHCDQPIESAAPVSSTLPGADEIRASTAPAPQQMQPPATMQPAPDTTSPLQVTTIATTTTKGPSNNACELLSPCSANGTIACQPLASTQFRCHCSFGFMGDTCAQVALFSSETSVGFNQQAYIQFRFNTAEEMQQQQQQQPTVTQINSDGSTFNASTLAKLSSMTESQNISFKVQSKSGYGLIFYIGQAYPTSLVEHQAPAPAQSGQQSSKSLVANMLARLSSTVFDHLAIALVDGHVELSYELGSGVAIVRSSRRVNDGNEHQIRVLRSGKLAKLTIDDAFTYEGSSPGKLSMLNSEPDIYLGGLPHLAEMTHNMYMSGFVGCLSNLEINSLGPINLIRSDHLTTMQAARNLVPCSAKSSGSGGASVNATIKHKPYQSPEPSDSDDPDEMKS